MRVWSGPVEDRVRIADPRRVRAARFDNVFVASLQDGEFPRGAAHTDPFLSERQRESLGLQPRHDSDAEERYLFHVCLALPRRRLFLSYRDSDENGGAEAPSPFLEDVRQMLEPSESELRGRGLAEVVHRVADAPSETELARAIAASRHARRRGAAAERRRRRRMRSPIGSGARLASARSAEAATRAPGPLSNPAVIAALGDVHAYGGTTLEGFDVCSYRWFVSHELSPSRSTPLPTRSSRAASCTPPSTPSTRSGPAATPCPGPRSLAAWIARSRELVGEIAAARGLGEHPAERAMLARIEGLLARFLAEEARRETAGFEPWLLEAGFSESEEVEQPALEIDGWRLHGAIDRVDRAPDGRALVLDYKLSSKVSPREKLEEEAKLQLQLYLIAVAELWGAEIVGGLYHPLRATSERRPRGLVLEDAAAELAGYGLAKTDRVDREEFEELLADARRRAGEIVARMRAGRSTATPARARACATTASARPFCDFAPICRRDRAPVEPAERRGGGRAVSERKPTAEQRAAIEATAAEVMVEAGAGTGKTGVMVDRYCRLVCEQRRLPRRGPRLHLHRQGRGRAAAADPGRDRAPGRGGIRARPRAAAPARQRLGDDDPRLLQPPALRPPGRGRHRSQVPGAGRPGDRAGGRRGLRRGARGLPGGRRPRARGHGRGLRHRRPAGDGDRRSRRAAQPRRGRAAASRAAGAGRGRARCETPPRPRRRRSPS